MQYNFHDAHVYLTCFLWFMWVFRDGREFGQVLAQLVVYLVPDCPGSILQLG